MDASLHTCLHPSTKLICTIRFHILLSCQLQHGICHQSLPSFPHPHIPHSGIIINSSYMDLHERAISCPWRPLIHQPLGKIHDNFPPLALCLTKSEYPMLQLTKLVPHVTASPDRRRTTSITVFYITLTGISTGFWPG